MPDDSQPTDSRTLFDDVREFFFRRPCIDTLVRFQSEEERSELSQRILQRIGVDVDQYSVLNIHRIGIGAPVGLVHEQVRQWDGRSACWPDHVATVESIDADRTHIKIRFLGRLMHRLPTKLWESGIGTLFEMKAIAFKHQPDPIDPDNARYLLYSCGGGYPIGVFCIYARSPITSVRETEPTQLFFAVGFDFFGRKPRFGTAWVGKIWEKIHNRVTSNILCKFRQTCEREFVRIQDGANLTAAQRPQ